MNYKKAIVSVLVLIIACTASFFAGFNYNNSKRLSENKKNYLNQIYFEIDRTIHLLSSVENWGNGINTTDVTINPYRQLLRNLDSMRVMSEQALLYMRDENSNLYQNNLDNLAESFRIIENAIGAGISLNNQHICDDFLNDGVLSTGEISFLNSLKNDLQSIKSGLHREGIDQENINLSMDELYKIITQFTDKYDITNLSGIGLKN